MVRTAVLLGLTVLCVMTFSCNKKIEKVRIGGAVWMKKNLDTDVFADGEKIPEVKDDKEWEKFGNEGKPAWCYYDNDPTNGILYNWFAVVGIHDNDPTTPNKTLAPEGWHIPTNAEWTTLSNFLGGTTEAGGKMKDTKTYFPYWFYPNIGATNEIGFSGLPGGALTTNGFINKGSNGYWWSSTEIGMSGAFAIGLSSWNSNLDFLNYYKTNFLSVRCLRD